MNKKSSGGVMVGTSSILVVFILLCLVTFATLSLVSAKADFSLSTRAAQTTKEYYEACNVAEGDLQSLDSTFEKLYKASSTKYEYENAIKNTFKNNLIYKVSEVDGKMVLQFETAVNQRQVLVSTLELTYPQNIGDKFYNIVAWKTADIGEWTPDEGLPVYSGENGKDGEDSELKMSGLPEKK